MPMFIKKTYLSNIISKKLTKETFPISCAKYQTINIINNLI